MALLHYVQLHKEEGTHQFRMEWNHHIESVRTEAGERRTSWYRWQLHKMSSIGRIVCVVNKGNNSYGVTHNVWNKINGDYRRERWRNGECAEMIQIIFAVFWNLLLGEGDKVVLLMYTHVHHWLCAIQTVSNFSNFLESLRCRIIVWIWIFHCRADKYLKWFHHSDTVGS